MNAYAHDFHTHGTYPLWRKMAPSQHPKTPHGRAPVADRPRPGPAALSGTAPERNSSHRTTPAVTPRTRRPSTATMRTAVRTETQPDQSATARRPASVRSTGTDRDFPSGADHGNASGQSTDPDPPLDGHRQTEHVAALAAMAALRPDDDVETATLRQALRDQRLMVRIGAAVHNWPALDSNQRDLLAALLNPRHGKH
jgi:hypothetical protein